MFCLRTYKIKKLSIYKSRMLKKCGFLMNLNYANVYFSELKYFFEIWSV